MINLITEHIDIWTAAQAQKSNGGRGRGANSNGRSVHGIKKLRELILELAVRGKLVPQDPNDEPAGVLLEKIAKEKTRLIKAGKIKKEKPLPGIDEDEKPFELPEGWAWTRLGNLSANIHYGYTASAAHSISGVRLLRITDIQNDSVNWETVPGCEIEKNKTNDYSLENGDIVIARTGGTIGKSYLVENINLEAVFASYLIRLKRIESMYAPFIKTYLGSQLYWKQLYENSMGTGQPNVNATSLKGLVFPIPPLAEQHRIVAKVDELMAICDQLEQRQIDSSDTHQALVETLLATLTHAADQKECAKAWQRMADHFDTLFTTEQSIDQLKQTILQLAVMGKLVPQEPNDEPAGVLLEKIAKEKARLIKAGKIKKEKPLPEISEDEKPFELPEGWKFAKFESVVDITSGVTKGRKLAGRKLATVPYLRVANVQRGFLELDLIKKIDIPEDEIEKFTVLERDLLITEGGDWDKVGRTAIWGDELPLIVHQNHVFKARCILKEQNEAWIEKYLNSFLAREYFESSSKQTTNLASINKTQLRGCIIAFPPLAEQHRIVAKVDELLALCDTLKARLNEAQTTQIQLADAMVEQAVA